MINDKNQKVINQIKVWKNDLAIFCRECFGAELDPWQAEVAELINGKANWKLSIRSGHGPGKTSLSAMIIWWFLATRDFAKIPCTAPTSHQLKDILWSELAKWYNKSQILQTMFIFQEQEIKLRDRPKEWWAVARTIPKDKKGKAEALQGFHADNLLFVVEEASGLDDIVFNPIEGAMTGEDACMLLISNPTRRSGYFFDTHNKFKKFFIPYHVKTEKAPRIKKEYIDMMADKWGVNSNVYKIRVLGEFPSSDLDSFIPMELCDQCRGLKLDIGKARPVLGIDVGRMGSDPTDFCIKNGPVIEPFIETEKKTITQTANQMNFLHIERKFREIGVDAIGIGVGVHDRGVEMGLPMSDPEIVVSRKATTEEEHYAFYSLRDQLWQLLKNCLEQQLISLPDDEGLVAEICSPLFDFPNGKLKIESKKEMKKRGLPSPNKADALCIALYLDKDYLALSSELLENMFWGERDVEYSENRDYIGVNEEF